MTAVFNAPDNGDSSVANEAKTSDAPKFDLQALYNDMSATTRGASSGNREMGNQIDFGTDNNLYARANDTQGNANGGFSVEQQGAMDIARRFASFDDDTKENTGSINFDREDAGRLVEVYGDMYNVQNSMQQGDKSDTRDWLGEMRKDLSSFTKGLFGDSDDNSRERHGRHGGHHSHDGDGENTSEESDGEHTEEESSGHESPENDCPEDECPEESGSEHEGGNENESGSEEGSEESENHESGDTPVESGSDGYTPQDSMVLLMNDMQQLTEALSSGDPEAIQQAMANMNRHLALLMRQLGAENGEEGSEGDEGSIELPGQEGGSPGQFDPSNPGSFLPNPEELIHGLPQPPNPLDLLRNLPQPPNPGDLLSHLPQPPNPQDLLRNLPQPPNPQDLLRNLPQPPNPQDLLRNLPQPPNPGDLLRNLPSPSDLFDIF